MAKIDLKKDLKPLYQASAKAVVRVEIPALKYLMVDGKGDPNTSPLYGQAVEALFSVSYAAKFLLKTGPQALDYTVMPLEGLWWADDLSAFTANDRSQWMWTMMILQPSFVSDATVAEAVASIKKKKPLLAVDTLRLESFAEGPCAQTLHVGPFAKEGPTIERVHAFIDAQSARRGKHHEIYLSDIRRADPNSISNSLM
jgi:hypothetical protein